MNSMANTTLARNPMLASTDPTDDELHQVMREARDIALQRKQDSDAWMRDQLNLAVREAQNRGKPHGG